MEYTFLTPRRTTCARIDLSRKEAVSHVALQAPLCGSVSDMIITYALSTLEIHLTKPHFRTFLGAAFLEYAGVPVHAVICLRTWSGLTFPCWMLMCGLVPNPTCSDDHPNESAEVPSGLLPRSALHNPGGLQQPLGHQQLEAHVDTCAHPAATGLRMLLRNTRVTLRALSTRHKIKDMTLM